MGEDKFIAALIRKFRATEAEPPEPEPADPPPPPTTSSTPAKKCALCRRSLTSLVWGEADERWWCPKSEADKCTRIALGRLGASASGAGNVSLRGVLDPDGGKCRDCGEPVKWVKTQKGKKMPVDVLPAPAGVSGFELVGEHDTLAFYVSEKRRAKFFGDCYEFHGSTCKQSRRPRG
jgi:hypothetical protein